MLLFPAVTSQINHPQQAMADASTSNNTTTTAMGMTPVLGNPIFSEHDKITSQKQVIINGSKGLRVAFSGNGTIKGIDFTDAGTALITFRSNGYGDLKGHGIITTTATGKDGGGTVNSNGATFFHTDSTTGKLAFIDNLVVITRNQVDKAGNDVTIGWEWK